MKKRILSFIILLAMVLSTSTVFATNDTYYKYQWALENDGSFMYSDSKEKIDFTYSYPGTKNQAVAGIDIDFERAQQLYSVGGDKKEIVIAVIDYAVDVNHEDLKNVIWKNPGEIPGNHIDDDGNGFIDDINGWNFYNDSNDFTQPAELYHATHCAGVIAAVSGNKRGVSGSAGDANIKIMTLKVLDKRIIGFEKNLANAIKYAEANGADICSISLSWAYSKAVEEAIKNSNMLFVCAAGNENSNLDFEPSYPAAFPYDNIISVANLTPEGYLNHNSNYGEKSVDLAAPGTQILSTINGNKYAYLSGTSMATPMVAAVAGMLMSYDSGLSPLAAKEIILDSVVKTENLAGSCAAGGYLSAGNAMALLRGIAFKDVKTSDSGYEAITYLSENGIMNGTGAGKFSPESTLTRAMVITILGRMAEHMGIDTAAISAEEKFADAKYSSWYGKYLNWASETGIVNGYSNGKFGPEDKIEAYQLGLILSRFAALQGETYETSLAGTRQLSRSETAVEMYKYLESK